MYVACPSCKSLYPVTADQLRLAGGQVRCGQCQTLFNAAQAVFEDPQQALAHGKPLQHELVQEIDALVDRALDDVGGEAAPVPVDSEATPLPAVELPGEVVDAADKALCADTDHYAQPLSAEFTPPPPEPESEPDELSGVSDTLLFHEEHDYSSPTSWGSIAASLLLTLALIAQFAYWDRYRLAQIDALRPAMELFCTPLKCDLPPRHDLARMEMIEREVRDHPNVDDALLVSAAFVNRAPFPQAYPVLQISFSDVSGTPVAVRRFMPDEYLRKKTSVDSMAPGEQTPLMLEVIDPGDRAVSFQFDFL